MLNLEEYEAGRRSVIKKLGKRFKVLQEREGWRKREITLGKCLVFWLL